MHRRQFAQWLSASALATCVSPRTGVGQEREASRSIVAQGRRVAATVHPLATQAAMAAFARGGNAVDAAVAASLMLSVVDIHNSGLGGGGLALVRSPQGNVFALDGRERAPLAAGPGTFMRNGKAEPSLSQTGPLAVGTPGLPALLERMARRFGAIDWRSSLEQAAAVAEQGFLIDAPLARNLKSNAEALERFPESARVLLGNSNEPLAEGQRLIQTELARTLRQLAEQGTTWFYRGEFAERTAGLMRETGGLLTLGDFQQYEVAERQPIESVYRGHRVFGFPPPSSGGLHIAQMLTMLSGYEVHAIFERSESQGLHLLAEVMKRAMADRAQWLGDTDFVGVPRGLLDAEYLAERAGNIDLDHSTPVSGAGLPPRSKEDMFAPGKHTTHLTAADEEGYVVALTQTINTSFGSKMIVPGTGVLLNNEMDDFSLAPGVRNAFGLVGSAANAVAPGKRPLSSMSPTVVTDMEGNFRLSCGAAGGPKIITTVLQLLVRTLDLGQPLAAALSAPRIHHQWSPDTLAYEAALSTAAAQSLEKLGHRLQRGETLAVAQGIQRLAEGQLLAASDPRVPSNAAAL